MEEARRVEEFIAGLPAISRRFLRKLQKRGTMTTVEAREALHLKNLHWVWGSAIGPLVQAFYTWEEGHGSELRLYDTERLEREPVGKMKAGLGMAGNNRWSWVYSGELDWDEIERMARRPGKDQRAVKPTASRAVVVHRPERGEHESESPRARPAHGGSVGQHRPFEPDESRRSDGVVTPIRESGWASGDRRSACPRRPVEGVVVETRGKPGTIRRL